MSIDDQAGEHRVGGKLLPDDIRMPGQHLRASIPEMRRERCTRGDRVANLLRRRGRMAEGGADA